MTEKYNLTDNKECVIGDKLYRIIDLTLELSEKAKKELKFIFYDALSRMPVKENGVSDKFSSIQKSWLDKNNIKLTDVIKNIKILNEKYSDIVKLCLFVTFPENDETLELLHDDYVMLIEKDIHSIAYDPDGYEMHKIDDILTIFITFSEGFV